MSEIIPQIISLMVLLIGVMVGEIVAFRAFGKPKPKILLIDMLMFVVVLTLVYSFISFTEAGLVLYAANFLIGTVTIISVRGVESLFRMTETMKGDEKIVVNIIRALSRYGLDEDEIRGVLKRSGISPKTVDRMSGLIEESVPAYVPKLVRLENEISEIRAGVVGLAASLDQMRNNDLKHIGAPKKSPVKRKAARKASVKKRTGRR